MYWHSLIDKTFVVTLMNPNRMRSVMDQMTTYHLPFEAMLGVENKENGADGLKETMLFLMNRALMMGYKKIMVLEDDFVFLSDPDTVMNKVVSDVPDDFHLLYLGANLLSPPEKHSQHLLKLEAAYTSHAVIYSIPAMRMICDGLEKYTKAYDQFLNEKIIPLGKSYCVYPLLVNQKGFKSGIWNYDPQKHLGLEKYYDELISDINWGWFIKEQYEKQTKHIK